MSNRVPADDGPSVQPSRNVFARFFAWLRALLRRKDRGGPGTPPNIYPLY